MFRKWSKWLDISGIFSSTNHTSLYCCCTNWSATNPPSRFKSRLLSNLGVGNEISRKAPRREMALVNHKAAVYLFGQNARDNPNSRNPHLYSFVANGLRSFDNRKMSTISLRFFEAMGNVLCVFDWENKQKAIRTLRDTFFFFRDCANPSKTSKTCKVHRIPVHTFWAFLWVLRPKQIGFWKIGLFRL